MSLSVLPLIFTLAVTVPGLPDLNEKQSKALADGKIVMVEGNKEDTNKFVLGVALVPAEAVDVWALLLDSEFMKTSSSAIEDAVFYDDRVEDGIRRMGIAWTLKVAFQEVKYFTLREYHVADGHMTWTLDPTKENDLASTVGSYTTLPGPKSGTTYLVYRSFFDAGRSMPTWVEESITEKGIKKYLKNLLAKTAPAK
jgi:hypothetical protein